MKTPSLPLSQFALFFTLYFIGGNFAFAQATDRYVVFSDLARDRAGLQVRHEFPTKFTAHLTVEAAQAFRRRGVRVERVPLFHPVAPPGGCTPWPECNGSGGGGGGSSRETVPTDQTPWGIEAIYNASGISSTSGGAGVAVAVLDTGVNVAHLDLANRVAGCVDFSSKKSPIIVGKCGDQSGHGTHVSGTILADAGNDGLGIYGVAPQTSLLAYKVCGNSGCWGDDIAAAIDYAGAHGAQIVSMSLGGDTESSLVRDAIDRNPSLLFIAAAGNDGPADGSIDYPGANQNVIAVGALDANFQVPNWSSRGINDGDNAIEEGEVEFAAPGVSVESTSASGGYTVLSGTSMATPHISGLAAKVWDEADGVLNGTGTAAATRSYLRSLVLDVWTAGQDSATGFGFPRVP